MNFPEHSLSNFIQVQAIQVWVMLDTSSFWKVSLNLNCMLPHGLEDHSAVEAKNISEEQVM